MCYSACNLKTKLGYDDSLDVVGVHGVGGTWGALATGLFASKAINPAGADGFFFGNPELLMAQAIAVVATWAFAFLGTLIILGVLNALMGLRVTEEEELESEASADAAANALHRFPIAVCHPLALDCAGRFSALLGWWCCARLRWSGACPRIAGSRRIA